MTTTPRTTRPISDPYFIGACATCQGPITYLGQTGDWSVVVELVGCPACRLYSVYQVGLAHFDETEDLPQGWAEMDAEVAGWTRIDPYSMQATHRPGEQCTLLCLERLLDRLPPDVHPRVAAAVAAMTPLRCSGPPDAPAWEQGDQADDVPL